MGIKHLHSLMVWNSTSRLKIIAKILSINLPIKLYWDLKSLFDDLQRIHKHEGLMIDLQALREAYLRMYIHEVGSRVSTTRGQRTHESKREQCAENIIDNGLIEHPIQ